ncbi:hypothetical protein B2K_39345 [Paenibacillus mucilaginosus K02]|uniref:Uncharacterized protein n=1 Tax=Paenibacillus mucilaginosus K02 TaxID=997761 RepID=R9UN47_9BACL|nr:hypothetical protein B2K_39345 [Paenibacillus mucilaginosus K02]
MDLAFRLKVYQFLLIWIQICLKKIIKNYKNILMLVV